LVQDGSVDRTGELACLCGQQPRTGATRLRGSPAKRCCDLFGLPVAQQQVVSQRDPAGAYDCLARIVSSCGERGRRTNRDAPAPITTNPASSCLIDLLDEVINLPMVNANVTRLDPSRPRSFKYLSQLLNEQGRLGIYCHVPHELLIG